MSYTSEQDERDYRQTKLAFSMAFIVIMFIFGAGVYAFTHQSKDSTETVSIPCKVPYEVKPSDVSGGYTVQPNEYCETHDCKL